MPEMGLFETLGLSGLKIANPAQDIRGLEVYDSGGWKMGQVDELIVDMGRRKVRFLQVGRNVGFWKVGRTHRLISVDAIYDIHDGRVYVSAAQDSVGLAVYAPALAVAEEPAPARPRLEPSRSV